MKFKSAIQLFVFCVSLILLSAHPSFALAKKSKVTRLPLLSFTTDGCTLSPDGYPGKVDGLVHCCIAHDVRYWRGGTQAERKRADLEFGACINRAQSGKPKIDAVTQEPLPGTLGWVYYEAVRGMGGPMCSKKSNDTSPFPWRWGYGLVRENTCYHNLPDVELTLAYAELYYLSSENYNQFFNAVKNFKLDDEQIQFLLNDIDLQMNELYLRLSPDAQSIWRK